MHELMHGLGPHDISVAGRTSTVRQELKETYSAIEEAKADISDSSRCKHLVDSSSIGRSKRPSTRRSWPRRFDRCASASTKHTARPGDSAELPARQGRVRNGDGTFSVDTGKIKDAVIALTREIMTLQAEGSYARAKQMIETLGVLRPPTKAVLDRLTAVPVDIEPRFVTAIDLLK